MLQLSEPPYVKIAKEALAEALTGLMETEVFKALDSRGSSPAAEVKSITRKISGIKAVYLSEKELGVLGLSGFKYRDGIFHLEGITTENLITISTLLTAVITADNQAAYQLVYDRAEKKRIDMLPVAEKPNQRLFREAQMLLLKTITGDWTDQYIHKTRLPIFFAERERNQRTGTQAFYSPTERKVRVYNEEKGKRKLTEDIIHEVRHAWQHENFPELFGGQESIVDEYVAMKLKELDAAAAEFDHKWSLLLIETKTEDMAPRHLEDPTAVEQARFLADNVHARMVDQIGLRLDYSHVFLTRNDHHHWESYEANFYHPPMVAVLESGNFEDRVATSYFLSPAFLQRFCVAPNGENYLPRDVNGFCEKLAAAISKLHHPVLGHHAAKGAEAREQRQILNRRPLMGQRPRLSIVRDFDVP